MTIFVPSMLRVPSYTIAGPCPVTLRVAVRTDEELVEQAWAADSVVVVAPGRARVCAVGRALGRHLAMISVGDLEPTFVVEDDFAFEDGITAAVLKLEEQERSLLATVHAFRDFGGLSALVVVLAPDLCDQATIRLPLDPRKVF